MSLISKKYKKKIFNLKKNFLKKKDLKIFKANFFIDSSFLNKNVLIYNGNNFISLSIKSEMIGFRFGDFITTRKNFTFRNSRYCHLI